MQKTAIIGLILLLLTGCEKIFHPADAHLANIQSYNELMEASGGVYARLLYMVRPEWGQGNLYLPNIKGDDITREGSNYINFYNVGCKIDSILEDPYEKYYIAEGENLYRNLYLVIISANNIITQFPDPWSESSEYRELIGEMYLIRAYCHLRLVRCFDRIPVVNDCNVDFSSPLPGYDQIYGQITADLKMAGKLLPQKSSESRIPYETPHQGSARILLAEALLSWAGYPANNTEKYKEAALIAGNLIDSADYFGLGLMPDFKDVWKRDPSLNKEVAFAVSYADPWEDKTRDYVNRFSQTSTIDYYSWLYCSPDSFINTPDFYSCEINFYNKYPASYRKDLTFFTQVYIPPDWWEAAGHEGDTGYIKIKKWDCCGRPAYRKFLLDPVAYSTTEFDNWWMEGTYIFGTPRVYFFRYAHALLTYAEAKARSGEPDASAYEAVNRIRRRAHHVDLNSPSVYDLQPGLSAEAFADSVVWERAWELAGEPEGRWFDLVRLEKVESLPRIRHVFEGDVPVYPITKEDYFFPIPEGDLHLNPNLQQ
ncbi:MAG: RagB/SusD family nutrient uptake outer membrane protein [Bacteroidales bacterium]|nr:RagB/SusD family nutrient uptake outer membrane protein [Bacteroidales bacterium]